MKYFSLKSIVQRSTFVYNNFMSQLPNCLLSLPHCPPRKHTPVFHLFIRCILSRMVNWRRSEGPQPHRHSESTGNCFLWSAVRSPHVPLCFLWLQQAPCSGKQVFTSSSRSPSITKASRGGIQAIAGTGAVSCLLACSLASAQLVFLWPEVVLPMVVCPLKPVRNQKRKMFLRHA